MDKTAIRSFAIEARKILMKSAITEAGFYGITKDGCKSPTQKGNDFEVYETVAGTENRIFGDDIKRRANLVKAIAEQGFDQVIEETAYTWFNRIIAIRFMEVNNYLPTRVRVLSSETGSGTPDIISQSDTVELNLSSEELEKVQTAKRENRYDDAFRLLFIKQCNELNDVLPGLFEKTDDYMELLLKITYTGDGVIRSLVDTIPESNFNVETEGQVEIIGWMYQYYNTELKDDTFAKLKKNVKITKERIPAATQLFTPDWIVRYMVENSLGRVWIEHLRTVDPSVSEKVKAEEFGWKYYLPEAEQEADVAAQLVQIRQSYKDLTPQDITCIDPCMGSGHILVYMFDVLMDIYLSEGFSEREAVFDILEKNIRGLDIDRRAYQLSYFALMMKARGYNRIFFRGHEDIDGNRVQAVPRVYAIEESNTIERDQLKFYGAGLDEMQKNNAINQMNGLLDTLHDAKEYGSILNVDNYDWNLLRQFTSKVDDGGQMSLLGYTAVQSQNLLMKLVDIGETLARKYDAVVTNPPYMSSAGMNEHLLDYIKNHYPNEKADLFSVFIEKCLDFTNNNGYKGMITQHAWMFLASFDFTREFIMKKCLINMVHLGPRAFDEISGEVVQTVAFVVRNKTNNGYNGAYIRVVDYDGEEEKRNGMLSASGNMSKDYYIANIENFKTIPGFPIIYWMPSMMIEVYRNDNTQLLGDILTPCAGLATGNNPLFQRLWYEVDINKIGFGVNDIEETKILNKRWYPCNSGGIYRKWGTDNWAVVNWENDGYEIRNYKNLQGKLGSRPQNTKKYFKQGITWNKLSTSRFAAKFKKPGFIFDDTSRSAFPVNPDETKYYLGLLCSCVSFKYLTALNPTMSFTNGDLVRIPCLLDEKKKDAIDSIVDHNIELSETDWNSFETSWDFQEHVFIRIDKSYQEGAFALANTANYYGEGSEVGSPVEACFRLWEKECNDRFAQLKENEEELNRIFIDIYGLQDELTPDVEDKDVTVRKADLGRDVRSLVSYAVGCMFGRYSLDEPGLICADGEFNPDRYSKYHADKDAIIPITDEQYFDDDIVGRFEEFIKTVYGSETIEQNLDFIADALGTKGNSSRDKIRNYFLNDFFKDHCNTYSVTGSGKRPIYWLFDSGKQNGFKCLIYLHRYTPDTVGLIRSDYLTKTQSMIENALKNAEYAINTSGSAVDRAQATKKRDKYIKQLAEIRAYYPALSHIALQRINLDLDDGVKVNYAKFQGIEVSIEGEKKQRVDLLAKI